MNLNLTYSNNREPNGIWLSALGPPTSSRESGRSVTTTERRHSSKAWFAL